MVAVGNMKPQFLSKLGDRSTGYPCLRAQLQHHLQPTLVWQRTRVVPSYISSNFLATYLQQRLRAKLSQSHKKPNVQDRAGEFSQVQSNNCQMGELLSEPLTEIKQLLKTSLLNLKHEKYHKQNRTFSLSSNLK